MKLFQQTLKMQAPSKKTKFHSPGSVTVIHWSKLEGCVMIFIWAIECFRNNWIRCQYFKTLILSIASTWKSWQCWPTSSRKTITQWTMAALFGQPLFSSWTRPHCSLRLYVWSASLIAATCRAPAGTRVCKLFFNQYLQTLLYSMTHLKGKNWW